MTPRPSAPFIIVNTAFLWVATAVAAVQLWPIYQDRSFLVVVVVAAVVGSVIAIVGALFRWPTALVVVASLAAFLVVGVPVAVPDAAIGGVLPSIDGLRQLLAGTALGWKQLLTITLPVGSYQALLVPVLVVVLVTTVAGLSAALRSRAGDAAALAPVVVLVVGIAFGPDSANWPKLIGLSLLGVLLVWLVWRRWYRRRVAIAHLTAATTDVGAAPGVARHRTFDIRSFVTGVAILAIAAVAAVSVTVAAPPVGARQVLRSTVVQPFDPRDYASPLSGFRSYLQQPTADATILSVSGLPQGALLRVATLDTYDGIVYSVGDAESDSASGAFTRVPFRFDQSRVDGQQVTLTVTVGDYTGPWVPTVGQLERVSFTGQRAATLGNAFYYNDTSGTAADVAGLEKGDSYTLEAVIPTQPKADEIAALSPGAASVPTPVIPQELGSVLDAYTSTSTSPGAKLAAMIAGLKANGHISHGLSDTDPPSRSGHSADRITTLLTDQRMIGDAEQFSVTAALMARQLGFPARVVFGFAPTVAATGSTAVTGASVTAWIQVDTSRYGWVDIDPSPAAGPIPDLLPDPPQVVSRPPSIVEPPADEAPSTESQTQPETTQDDPSTVPAWVAIALLVARVLGITLLALGILVSPFLAVIAAKARRRRRRRTRGEPVDRITGGWHEYRDTVVDHGIEPPPSATRTEVAMTAGGTRAALLAAVADRAVFAPEGSNAAEADRVWGVVDDLRSSLDAGLTRRQRFAARVSLRSFGDTRLARALLRREGSE